MTYTISITIPCRNEERFIGKCLDSIVNSDYPKEKLMVFVCDGMSTDSTVKIVNEFSSKYSFIKLIENHNLTTPFALNIGLKHQGFDIKMILGAHSEIYPNYLMELSKILEKEPEAGCIGGVIENTYENKTSEIIGKAMSSKFGVGNAYFRTGGSDGYVDTVAFGAYRKEVFEKIGYFDTDLARNQDDEFNYRLISNGFKIYLSSSLKIKYYVRASYSKLFKQYFQYGYWKVYVNKKHNTITTVRQLIPALFVCFLALGTLLSFLWPVFVIPFLIVLLTYFIAATFASSLLTKSFVDFFGINTTFLILHLSYGLGYIEGIFRFILLGKNPKTSSQKLTR